MNERSRRDGADLWVVIPAFNEERWIGATLDALATQQVDSPYTVLVVDNASTDGTSDLVHAYAAAHPRLDLRVLHEPEKGTGAAADSGFRHAIESGARFVLRTDADSIPAPDWVAQMRRHLDEGGDDMVGGRVRPRTDDGAAGRGAVLTAAIVVALLRHTGFMHPDNRGSHYRSKYTLIAGFNLGVRAEAYLASGGFPRSSIEDTHEDWALNNRVRAVSDRVAYRRSALVSYSNRRIARHGLRNVIRWYTLHSGPVREQVDVR